MKANLLVTGLENDEGNAIVDRIIRTGMDAGIRTSRSYGFGYAIFANLLRPGSISRGCGRGQKVSEAHHAQANADMIVLLASDKTPWLNGACIPLEGGYSLGHL